jgi:hypothetical protein
MACGGLTLAVVARATGGLTRAYLADALAGLTVGLGAGFLEDYQVVAVDYFAFVFWA